MITRQSNAPIFGLTPMQLKLLDFIIKYIGEKRCSPTYDEMCDGIGMSSKSGINRLVIALSDKGHIRHIPNRARSILPTDMGYAAAKGRTDSIDDQIQSFIRKLGRPAALSALKRELRINGSNAN